MVKHRKGGAKGGTKKGSPAPVTKPKPKPVKKVKAKDPPPLGATAIQTLHSSLVQSLWIVDGALPEQAAPAPKAAPRLGDQQQVDVGTFNLYQDWSEHIVGELLVEEGTDDQGNPCKFEHWGLYSQFSSPCKRLPDTVWRFQYTGQAYPDVDAFLRHLREIGDCRYIMATCVTVAL